MSDQQRVYTLDSRAAPDKRYRITIIDDTNETLTGYVSRPSPSALSTRTSAVTKYEIPCPEDMVVAFCNSYSQLGNCQAVVSDDHDHVIAGPVASVNETRETVWVQDTTT